MKHVAFFLHAFARTLPVLILEFTLIFSTTKAAATTLFSNLGQANNGTTDNLLFTGHILASDFQTNAFASTITGTTLRLQNDDDISHHITVGIYSDNGGAPGALVGTFDTITLLAGAGAADITTSSTGINLNADTKYWEFFTMQEDAHILGPSWLITASNTPDTGSQFTLLSGTSLKATYNGGASWSDSSSGNANGMFTLEGTQSAAPEPGRAVLMFVGVGAALLRRRRPVTELFQA